MPVEGVNQNLVQYPQKKTGGGGKAVASAFIPGLGQFCDGRNKEGAAYLGTTAGLTVAGALLQKSIVKDAFNYTVENGIKVKSPGKVKLAASFALGLASLGLWIANIVDAYKGDRKKAVPADNPPQKTETEEQTETTEKS